MTCSTGTVSCRAGTTRRRAAAGGFSGAVINEPRRSADASAMDVAEANGAIIPVSRVVCVSVDPSRRQLNLSVRPPAANHRQRGFPEQNQIGPKALVFHVPDVHADPVLEFDVGAAADLPQARQAGADRETSPLPECIAS